MRYIISCLLATLPALAMAEVPRVITDIPPVHALAAQVMGDLGEPVLLLGKGADEHDFALRPSQAQAVAEADLVVWIGPELTPWLDRALSGARAEAAALALLRAEGTLRRAYGGAEAQDHDHDHDHDQGPEAGDGADPHAWLDPGNAKIWLGLIAAELARIDPAHAADYAANATAASARIDQLDTEIAALLAPARGRQLVVFHAAYGYFAAHYGLRIAASFREGDAAQPGAARLSELRALLSEGAIACIFPEVQHDPEALEQITEGTGVRIGGALDPVGSSLEPGPGAYDALLRSMASTIAACIKG